MPRVTGKYSRTQMGGEEVAAFIPAPLPPHNPPLVIDKALGAQLHRAETALARLELAGAMVPSVEWFIYSFVRKEAVISSQIEGTQATLIDLLTFEAVNQSAAAGSADVQEVCNYLEALTYARKQLHSPKGLALSTRLLNETHRHLLKGVRGAEKQPGEIRRSQNWLGGTRPGNAVFVPPPAHLLVDLLGSLEKFIHGSNKLPTLVRAGLVHVQFETIHPYLDGNGRIGRLLVTLLLEHWQLLKQPLLYLSWFFKKHRAEYYRRLEAVRTEGDFEGWLSFFLEGVAETADEAVVAIQEIFALISRDRAKVLAAPSAALSAARLFELLPDHPIVSISRVVRLLKTTKPTASKAITALVEVGVLVETSVLIQGVSRPRERTYGYAAYLDLLRRGTDL